MEFLGSLTNKTENAEQKISEKIQEAKLMVTRIPGIKENEKMQTRSVFNKTSLTTIGQMLWLLFYSLLQIPSVPTNILIFSL